MDREEDHRVTHKKDEKDQKKLVEEFCFVLSRGIVCQQHVIGVPNSFNIILRLDPSGTKLTWQGGAPSLFTGYREISLADVSLVTSGVMTANFKQVRLHQQQFSR